ncbi:hypothetical protein B0I35DRAFT_452296 [Stachybotrys elegans]|uniref:FAD-binding FR-type domain-containing protein n=1 Tax=Stachybotrys elegans TaxID=80388 RepID=A0A8K0SM05_9HYPO|nr:hypothetical protein B0I35DRAFT_452296 [Stachybotrys elegans]
MGCLSHRKKQTEDIADQKWDYINLQDFKAKGCGIFFAYSYLWFMLLLSIAFYTVDTWTAVNLLFYGRRVSQVEPAINPDIAKWIFSVCVILSFVNLGYEGIRAWRVMRRGNVAECYLDSLAVRWESIRFGSGQGFRRFLVFAELTKSKKGAEYIALFTYFSLQSWIRVLICSGPRQVVNVFTLRSVYDARFAIRNATIEGSISDFFRVIAAIAEEDYRLAVTLCGMCFTLVIWTFSVLFLIAAVLFYVCFLFHWIPRADGGLSGYCERKVTKALLKIVTDKVNKALAKGQTDRMRAEIKAAKKNGEMPSLNRVATLPTLPNIQPIKEDSLPKMPTLSRTETMTTLPAYTSRPGTPGGFELMDQKRPPLPQNGARDPETESRMPLVGAAADMGYGRPASPAQRYPNPNGFPQRPGTSHSQRSYAPRPIMTQHTNSGSDFSLRSPGSEFGGSVYSNAMPAAPGPMRTGTMRTMDSYQSRDNGSTFSGSVYSNMPPPGPTRTGTMTMDSYSQSSQNGSTFGGSAPPSMRPPARSATGPLPPRGPPQRPQRNMTAPNDIFSFAWTLGPAFNPLAFDVYQDPVMPGAVSASGWHEGEEAMHRELKLPPSVNPTADGLPGRFALRVMQSPLVAVGTLDAQGRPWTTVWGGERGFTQPIAQNILGFNASIDSKHDPVFRALWGEGSRVGDVVQPNNGQGKMMSGVAFDPETRDRVKLAGSMVAGSETSEGELQMAMAVTESLGNCPKYINKKIISKNPVQSELAAEGLPLSQDALDLLDKADLMFLSSTNGDSMDTNNRGGMPGFIRVVKNTQDSVELIYPEWTQGNRFYQTLGNVKLNPLVGIVIPDFETSNALYLTGSASILVGDEASALLARTKLAVKITVTDARFVKASLPFRGAFVDFSPYSPPVRHLTSERDAHAPSRSEDIYAELVRREPITPTVSRFTFRLSSRGEIPAWHAGQYMTLDFGPELSLGYSHMRDDDPQSINDDFIRTFTISSAPGTAEVQVTARKHGPATGLLWKHNLQTPLEVRVLGFGGDESFRLAKAPRPVFVAGGVGITPLLAQAEGVLGELQLLWSLRGEDLPLAVDSFERIAGLGRATTLFVTGNADPEASTVERLEQAGARVVRKRLAKEDVERLKGEGHRFFLCTGGVLLKRVAEWLEGEDVVWESFEY